MLRCLSLDKHALLLSPPLNVTLNPNPQKSAASAQVGCPIGLRVETLPPNKAFRVRQLFSDVLPGLLDPVSSEKGEMGTSVL